MPEIIAQHQPCPNCGREMEFDPEKQTLACRSCGEGAPEPPPAANAITESDFAAALRHQERGAACDAPLVVVCDNCAAETVLPPHVAADRCVYCDSPLVAAGQVRKVLRPAAVMPFAVSREKATAAYRDWLRSRWFLPNAARQTARLDAMSGVYLPFWTYDCRTTTRYTGSRGIYYYVQVPYAVTVNGRTVMRTRTERRTRWYPVSGMVGNRFDDILIPGGQSLPADLLKELAPWPLAELKPYHPDFIRGFREDVYTVDLEAGFARAKGAMKPEIEETIRTDIGGNEQSINSMQIDYREITFKHILLPVWVSVFRFRNRAYPILVNARTGEVQGRRPWSVWKIIFAVLTFAAAAGLAAFLLTR
jgi:hypothetical protein